MKKRWITAVIVVLAACALTLTVAGCKKEEQKQTLATPSVLTYDADLGRIEWSSIGYADTYKISINGGEEQTTRTPTFSYESNAEFTVSVRASRADETYLDSETVSMTFVPLERIATLNVADDGAISWQAVAGATGYEVYVNGAVAATVTETKYAQVPVGLCTVKVKPVVTNASAGISFYAKSSDAVDINILAPVNAANVKYEDGAITWSGVAGASRYEVTINDAVVTADCTTTRYEYDANNGNFTVSIRALGDHTATHDGAPSETKRYVYLRPVTNITVDSGVLVWDEVDGATSYQINNNNVRLAVVEDCAYDKLSAGTSYAITILPIAAADATEYYSSWSANVNVRILPAPIPRWTYGLSLNGQEGEAFNWDNVPSATGYAYELTDPSGATVSNALATGAVSYRAAFAEVGTYRLRFKSVAAAGSGYFDSAYTPMYNIVRLPAPTIDAENVTSTADDLSRGFTVSFDGVTSATAYRIYKNDVAGVTSTSSAFTVTDIVDSTVTTGANVSYYVQSIGSSMTTVGNSGERRVVLDSITADAASGTSAFAITVLSTPSQTPQPIQGTVYSFGAIAGSFGYAVQIGGTRVSHDSTSYDLNGIAAGAHEVSVCAKGNGKTTLPSRYTTPIDVVRLAAPDNVRITTQDAQDGELRFDAVAHAESYMLTFTGGNEQPVDFNNFPNLKSQISTAGTTLSVRSVANVWDNNVYYMSSLEGPTKTFIKLSAPQNMTFTNTQLLWNAPNNVDADSVPTVYRIYDGSNDTTYNTVSSATAFDISEFEGGKSYVFSLVAEGDGKRFINSDKAEYASIYKLATPELTVNRTESRYEWYGVESATAYEIEIDGVVAQRFTHDGVRVYSYVPTYTGTNSTGHTVRLYAVGNAGAGNSTVNSKADVFLQVTKQLNIPTFSVMYSDDTYNVNGTLTITVVQGSTYADGYTYSIGGATRDGADSYAYTTSATGPLDIYVYARGGKFDEDNVYYTDSQNAPSKNVNILLTPTQDSMQVNRDGRLTWGQVSGAVGYKLTLSFTTTENKQGTAEINIDTNTASYSLSQAFNATVDGQETQIRYADIKTMTVTVQALGTLKANVQSTNVSNTVSGAPQTKEWASALH